MRTRDLLRFVPGLGRLVRSLDVRERESRLLTEECQRLANENHRLKVATGAPRANPVPPPRRSRRYHQRCCASWSPAPTTRSGS